MMYGENPRNIPVGKKSTNQKRISLVPREKGKGKEKKE
jgi:hypothetical protein